MYSKLIVFFLAFFGILAAALPNNPPPTTTTVTVTAPAPTETSQCNTGNAECCNTVGDASSNVIQEALGVLSVLLGDITGIVGLGCTSIIGGANCAQTPVCCTGNKFNGLINIGCSPIVL